MRRVRKRIGFRASDHFSRMWRSDPGAETPETYGPHRVVDEQQRTRLITEQALFVRDLCLYASRQIDIARAFVHEEKREQDLEQIADRFILKGRESVCDFLRGHRSLIPVLVEVREKFDQYFGVSEFTRPRLEVFIDPEGENSEPILFALVPTTLPFQEVVTRVDRLDEDWWLDQPSEVRCLMNIDVEYVNAPTI